MDNIEWENVVHQKATTNPASAYIVDREAKDALQLYTGLDEQGEDRITLLVYIPTHPLDLLSFNTHIFDVLLTKSLYVFLTYNISFDPFLSFVLFSLRLGGIYRIGRGMRVSKLASRNFPGAFAVQSLVITTPIAATMGANGSAIAGSSSGLSTAAAVASSSSYSMFFLSFPDKTRVFQCGNTGPTTASTTTAAGTGGGIGNLLYLYPILREAANPWLFLLYANTTMPTQYQH